MKQDIKKILEELYALDESLRKHEADLAKSLEHLLAARPEAKVDKAFAKQLRLQLLKSASGQKAQPQSIINTFNVKFMNKLAFAVGGAALALIIAIPLLSDKGGKQLLQPASDQLDLGTGIIEIKDSAFGSLSADGQAEETYGRGAAKDLVSATEPMLAAAPFAVADNAAVAESAPAPMAMVEPGFGGGGAVGKMIMPIRQYKYVYKGDDIELADSQLAVLRRIKGGSAAADLARRISNIDFGVLNLGSFTDQKVQNISVAEDKAYGYMINVNLMEGMLNIGQNWQQWPQVDYSQRLSLSDFPSDDKLVEMADKFLKQHNISTDNYAVPIVRDEWRLRYEQTSDKSSFYVPDHAQVIYPLLVNGQVVYDQGGNETGLIVGISIRQNRVSNVSNLTSQQYESSQYAAVTDAAKIIKIAEQGSMYPVLYRDNSEIQEVELGTPKQVLMNFYHYNDGQSQELLAPALIFPVISTPEGDQYYRTSVTVPLVADLIPDQRAIPEPMPVRIMEEQQ